MTSSAYEDWGLVSPNKPILQDLSPPPKKANFEGDKKKFFGALRQLVPTPKCIISLRPWVAAKLGCNLQPTMAATRISQERSLLNCGIEVEMFFQTPSSSLPISAGFLAEHLQLLCLIVNFEPLSLNSQIQQLTIH